MKQKKHRKYKETEFTICCRLARYVLIVIVLSYLFSVLICAPFFGDEPNAALKEAIPVSLALDGLGLVLLTLMDMLITLLKFLSTHKIYLVKIEERPVKTQ